MINIIIQSIKIHKKKYILTIIQFVICFSSLIFGVTMLDDLFQYSRRVEDLADYNTLHIYSIDENQEYDSHSVEEKINKVKNVLVKLNEEENIETIGIFDNINVYETSKGDRFEAGNVIMVSEEMFNITEMEFSDGSAESLISYEYGDSKIPVLVSDSFAEDYQLDSEYTYYYNEDGEVVSIDFVVKGFVSFPKYFWKGNSSDITSNLSTNDKFIICPQFREFSISAYEYNILATLNDERDNNIENISSFFEEEGLMYEIDTLNEEVERYYDSREGIVFTVLAFAIIILVLSVLGCIGVILCNIMSRRKEFGIYYSLGLSRKMLFLIVIAEILFIFLIGFCIATILCITLVNGMMGEEMQVRFWSVGVTFVLMIVCTLLCEIIPVRRFSQIEIIKLVNESKR